MTGDLRQKIRQVHKDQKGKLFTGVCSGIAKGLMIDATFVRFFFAFLTLFYGLGVVLYVALYFILPDLPKNKRRFTIKDL